MDCKREGQTMRRIRERQCEQSVPREKERERNGTKLQRSKCFRNLDNVKDSRGGGKEGILEAPLIDGGKLFREISPGGHAFNFEYIIRDYLLRLVAGFCAVDSP
jgi:hypothetical protein